MRLISRKIPDTQTILEMVAAEDDQGRITPDFTYQTIDVIETFTNGTTKKRVTPHGSLSDAVEAAMLGLDELSVLHQVAVCATLAVRKYMRQRNSLTGIDPLP